jgi:hypothetical protein
MKEDVPPLPARVPAKRRQLRELLDVHIALWLAGDDITPSERRRLQVEKQRRKSLVADRPVGLLVGREGVTPDQQETIVGLLAQLEPTEVHHPRLAGSLHSACKRLDVPVILHDDVRVDEGGMREVIRNSSIVIGAPKERSRPASSSVVWDMIRYAKHRSLAVKVVLPDGGIHTGLDET